MSQSKSASLKESLINTFSALLISWMIQAYLVPFIWPNVQVTILDAFWITILYTVVAITRNYAWRRFFNARS